MSCRLVGYLTGFHDWWVNNARRDEDDYFSFLLLFFDGLEQSAQHRNATQARNTTHAIDGLLLYQSADDDRVTIFHMHGRRNCAAIDDRIRI